MHAISRSLDLSLSKMHSTLGRTDVDFGLWLRTRLVDLDISKEELAEKLNWPVRHVYALTSVPPGTKFSENFAESVAFNLDHRAKIAEYFDVLDAMGVDYTEPDRTQTAPLFAVDSEPASHVIQRMPFDDDTMRIVARYSNLPPHLKRAVDAILEAEGSQEVEEVGPRPTRPRFHSTKGELMEGLDPDE